MWSVIKAGTRGLDFLAGSVSNKRMKLKLFGLQGEPSTPILSPTGISWSSHKEKPEEGAWSAYCNDFEKSEGEYFLSKQQIYRMQV